MATRRMLAKLGHRVIETHSSAKALEVITADDPVDLMSTNFSMPKMTGMHLPKPVRALRPNLSILLATGTMTFPERTTFQGPVLSKPYMQTELRDKIRQVMTIAQPSVAR